MSVGPLPVHKPRLEALSDGVVAVVMTLLVLELKIEHLPPHATSGDIWHALRELWRPFLGYIVAFALTGVFWYRHHQILTLVHRINGKFVAATLFFLLSISLLPFSVSLFMRSPTAGAAATIYYGNFALVGTALLTSWLYARHAGFTDKATLPVRSLTYRLTVLTIAGLLAVVGGQFSIEMGNLCFVAAAIIGGGLRRRLEATATPLPATDPAPVSP
jgi:uncharacterized membrane protein